MGPDGRVLGLAALALNSKEMAVTLPVALWLIEFIYHRPRQGRVVIATTLLTVIVMAVKLGTYNPLSRDPRYHISVSASGVIEALCRYFDALIYRRLSLRRWGCWSFAQRCSRWRTRCDRGR